MNIVRLFVPLLVSAFLALPAFAADPVPDIPPPSSAAQQLFSKARVDLFQIRALVKNGRTQSSVGSGFLVGNGNLLVTNFHVVSLFALEPETYSGEYEDTKGKTGPVELLAVDVLHDLAVLRINRNGSGFFQISAQDPPLGQGQHLFSMGNPLDLGFAISEGGYNGIVHRSSFYDQLMFTGPINPGMSGGPNINEQGMVVGVNVSKRLDGELVSFLVPVKFVREVLQRARQVSAPPKNFYAEVGKQLLVHQKTMTDGMLASPFNIKALGPYRAPVRDSEQMRCWGRSAAKPTDLLMVDQVGCNMGSAIFITDELESGQISMRHEFSRSTKLDALRFSIQASHSFANEFFGSNKDARMTAPSCTEHFVNNGKLAMRAVICARAYRKLDGLYDLSVLTASMDDSHMSLQSRLDANGVSFENGQRLAKAFMDAIGREKK